MAESITEGTLKQWSKREWHCTGADTACWSGGTDSFAEVGDFVEQDEEIATIETDKVGGKAHMAERHPDTSRSTSP